MHKDMWRKGLIVVIIVLFIGASVVPSISRGNRISSIINAGDNITNTISSKPDAAASRTTIYNGSLSGYVNDTYMNPIGGALVRVYFHGTYEEEYSDENGYYHVTNIPICWCYKNCTASKEGYETEWIWLSIGENTTYDFILAPLTQYDGSLSGYVNDTSVYHIEGALVRVYFHGTYEEDYSDSTGYYHVTNIPICYCLKNCTASKEGYSTEWVLLGIAENTTYDFVLEPLTDYNGSLSGYVNDTLMNPIEGARVRVYFHETYEEDYTDSSGYYHVTNIPICNCTKNATASKEGYETEWVLLSIDENTTYDFVLTPSAGNTLYVGGDGPGNYSRIQDAIDNASEGDTVFVYNDSSPYYENVVVNKTINLMGEDRNNTIIDGGGSGDVVNVTTDYVNISGFLIQHGGVNISDNGVNIHSNYNSIYGNIMIDNYNGLRLYFANYNKISNNIMNSNNRNGIYNYFSINNTISYNTISFNDFNGIYIAYSSNNSISKNYVSNCSEGIRIKNSENSIVFDNNLFNNTKGIFCCCASSNNWIYHNNLFQNEYNAMDISQNYWYNSIFNEGNYYDDYIGEDNNGDRIGDFPYNISEGNNQDFYPLMYPWSEMPPVANFSYSTDNLSATFDASSSYDRDGTVISYAWDFGDDEYGNGIIVEHTYSEEGEYPVTLTVIDDDGYEGNITKTITLDDFVPPEIIDNTPTEGYTGDSFTFNATITDAGGIDTAWVTWWYDSTALSVELNYIGDDNYEKTITIQDTLETLSYYISANDTSDNWQYTNTSYVTIYDNDKPEISDVQANPSIQNIGGYVNISGTVIDNIEVDEVYLYILYPDSTVENISITDNNIGDTYYCNKTYQEPGVYTYHIWANDTSGNSNISSDYTFEIINQPPYIPSDPYPENGSTGVSIYVDLSWVGGDPDLDPVDYDVYFGTSSPPPQVASNQSSTIYNPGTLEYFTTYYWQIVAWDNHGAFAEGPVWSFTTESESEPDLYCEGSLYWDGVISGEPVTGSFLLFNVGDSSSLLDWEVVDWPEWGTWAFTPDSGEDLTPEDGAVTVTVFVVAPDEGEFTGEVKIINSENPGDYCTIDATMTDSVNQIQIYSYVLGLIQRFVDENPALKKLLLSNPFLIGC